MADTQIKDLPAASETIAVSVFPGQTTGATESHTAAQLAAFVGSHLALDESYLRPSQNLADITNPAAGRANLGVRGGTAQVDFGGPLESDSASVSVAASWVTAGTIITVSPAGTATPDHDPDDYALEGLAASVANIQPGEGFDIVVTARIGSWGRFNVNWIGIAA
jgi:hypothetical protein